MSTFQADDAKLLNKINKKFIIYELTSSFVDTCNVKTLKPHFGYVSEPVRM